MSWHPFEEHPMQGIHRTRIGRRLAGISVLAFLVLMIAPSLARPQSQAQADGDKPKENTPSSYDQIAPVLLGQGEFPGRDGQGQGRQGSGHGPPEEAAGGALRPHPTARREGDDVARQADPGRPDREAAGGNDLGATGRDGQRRDPRQGTVSQGVSSAAPSQARGRAAWSSRRWRSSSSPAWNASTSTSTCPSTSCPSFRRPST